MSMYGADPKQLRELATSFANAAQSLRDASGTLSSNVANTRWRGGDADQFKGRWRSVNRARIESAAGIIDDAVVTLRRNADEQDRASSVEAGATLPGIDGILGQVPQPLPGPNAPRDEVESWWNGLSPEEQAEWLDERPRMIGNRDGIPLETRFEANRIQLEREVQRLENQSGASAEDLGALQTLQRQGTRLLYFEPDEGVGYRIAVALGDLDNAEEVAITVSGTSSDLRGFADNFYPESVGLVDYDRNRAVIATLVWTPPPGLGDNVAIDNYVETMITGGAMDNLVSTASAEFGDVVVVSHSAGTDAMQTWATRSPEAHLVDGYMMLAAPDPDEAFLAAIGDKPVVYGYHAEDPIKFTDLGRPDTVADKLEASLGVGDWGQDNVRFEYKSSGLGPEFSVDQITGSMHHRNSAYFDNFGGEVLDSVFDDAGGVGV